MKAHLAVSGAALAMAVVIMTATARIRISSELSDSDSNFRHNSSGPKKTILSGKSRPSDCTPVGHIPRKRSLEKKESIPLENIYIFIRWFGHSKEAAWSSLPDAIACFPRGATTSASQVQFVSRIRSKCVRRNRGNLHIFHARMKDEPVCVRTL